MCPAVIILLLLGTQKMGVFPWLELPSELRNVIRSLLDNVTMNMLGDTCKGESQRTRMHWFWWNYARLFKHAAKNGHFTLCCWIYARTANWTRPIYDWRLMPVNWGPFTFDSEYVRVRGGETRYSDRYCIEWALKGGHVHIATWMHSIGLKVRNFKTEEYVRDGNLVSFSWLYKTYPSCAPLQLDQTVLDCAIVRYPVEECKTRLPLPCQLRKMFKKLPASADVLAYYYSVCPDCIPDRILHKAIAGGKWPVVDFIEERMPAMMERVLARWPHLVKVIALAPKVPPKHRLDLCTGEVVIIE
jgi:hypothetical protein